MKTSGTRHIRAKEVQILEDISTATSYRRIKEVFQCLNKRRLTSAYKVTIKEYCEHYGMDLSEFVKTYNETFTRNKLEL